jgi:hypothetical protein
MPMRIALITPVMVISPPRGYVTGTDIPLPAVE